MWVFLIIMMLKSVWHLLEAPKNDSPFKCLESVLMKILLAYCKKKRKEGRKENRKKKANKKTERKQSKHQKLNTTPILSLYLTRINLLLLFWVLFFPVYVFLMDLS